MNYLPNDVIGLNKVVSFEIVCRDLGITPTVNLFRVFQILCKQGDWFSFAKRRNTEDVYTDEGPSSMKMWKNKFFLLDRRAIPDYLTWRSSQSCVFDDFPTDGYDRNYVTQLCAHLIRLREVNEAVLVRSEICSAWFNQKCDPVFRRKDDNFGNLERDEGNSSRDISAPVQRSGKRLRSLHPCLFNLVLSDRSPTGAANASSPHHADVHRGAVAIGAAGKARAEVIRRQLDPPMDVLAQSALARDHEYDQILDDDFSTATLGEEIDLTLFPLASRSLLHALSVCRWDLHSLCDASSDEVRKLRGQLAEVEVAAARSSESWLLTMQNYQIRHLFCSFIGSGVDGLVRKLLSSDEFNATLARILSLGITSGVERGLCMGRTDAQFEEATQNVSNFFLGAEAVFNKAIAALPSTHFPFLAKIVEAAESALPEIAVLLPLTSLSSTLYS
ncbi:hypothetical protein Tco_1058202 [Tanacetum coccineum]|uniref:Uncharacterized protein n=1 Tax=Tanacetum coccineum TaxID=301880 RepID=A0ABQ5H881_9ASTR